MLARAGKRVLVLEKSTEYRDRVRGEWIAPWGVVELKALGLYDEFIAAGAHHVTTHVSYGDGIDPAAAEAAALPLVDLLPGIPGPLCIGHPRSCNLLHDAAVASGATVLRDVSDIAQPDVRRIAVGDVHARRAGAHGDVQDRRRRGRARIDRAAAPRASSCTAIRRTISSRAC